MFGFPFTSFILHFFGSDSLIELPLFLLMVKSHDPDVQHVRLHLGGQDHNGQAMHGCVLPEARLDLGANSWRFVHEFLTPEIESLGTILAFNDI